MKLFNLFKKETANSKKVSVQKLEKNQLSQVIGGGNGDLLAPPTTGRAITKAGVGLI
jgi:hypothetical protein